MPFSIYFIKNRSQPFSFLTYIQLPYNSISKVNPNFIDLILPNIVFKYATLKKIGSLADYK